MIFLLMLFVISLRCIVFDFVYFVNLGNIIYLSKNYYGDTGSQLLHLISVNMKIKEGELCRLCLRTVSNEMFEEMGKIIKKNLEVLQLKLNFHIADGHIVCGNCMGSIKKCLDFKSIYLNAEDFIAPLYNSESESKLDLREVYVQKNAHMPTADVARDQEICRFCMKLNKSSSCKPLIEMEENMLQKCTPELNFNLTKEPVVCESCLNSLKFYFQFLQTCMDTEQKIIKYCTFEATGSKDQINLSRVVKFAKNALEHERGVTKVNADIDGLRCESKDNNVINTDVIKKEIAEFDGESGIKTHAEGSIVWTEINEEPLKVENEELEMVCEQNGVQTKQAGFDGKSGIRTGADGHMQTEINEYSIKAENGEFRITYEQNGMQTKQSNFESFQDVPTSSQSIMKNISMNNPRISTVQNLENVDEIKGGCNHQSPSEITVYKCESCSFVSKQKSNLKKHMLSHREFKKATEYWCESCPFATKQKNILRSHMLVHRKLLDVTVYRCGSCSYVTKRKDNLSDHMVVHQSSEIIPYNCDQCSFETKHKKSLKTHMWAHRRLSQDYKCGKCSFVTKHINSIKAHMSIHREVTVLKCECCSYITTQESFLKLHMLDHQKLPEVTIYKCESCSYVSKHKSNVNSHKKLNHRSDITVYDCDRCTFKTKYKNSLKKHMLTHIPVQFQNRVDT